jgi:hypothetical protein
MKSAELVRMKDLELSDRAVNAILSVGGFAGSNPSLREVLEVVSVARLLEVPGVGKGTVAEVEQAIRDAVGVAFVDSPPSPKA